MGLSAGDRLDRFTIEGLLGRGGMGVVYRATDPRLGRRVAIKLLEGLTADSPARARFDREARLIASLDHPAAVHVYEAGESGGTPYIVMELVEGVTLRVAAATEPSWRVKVGWLVEAASALAAAHDAGLVHRDVKPDNVMVRPDGRVKVLDFGIARRVRLAGAGETAGEQVTAEGTIVGTPSYMAPEQLRGEPLDGRADQFAWGVTAYEVLSGESPWGDTEDAVSLISRILGSPAPPVIARVPDLPIEVANVLMRTLAKERRTRFSTMREVVEALWAVLGGRPAPVSGGAAADAVAPTVAGPVALTPPKFTPEALAPTEALSGPPVSTGPTMKPPPARRSLVLPLGLVLLVVASAAAWAVRRSRATAAPMTATASASASAAPAPVSTNPEAARLYAEGSEIWRTDSDMAGISAWQAALKLDPDLCQANVQIAALGFTWPDLNPGGALEAARKCEKRLDARDRALLDAVAPLLATPVDRAGFLATTQRAVEAFPDDLECLYVRGCALSESDPAAATAVFDHVVQLDPRFVHAYSAKAQLLEQQGRLAEAQETLTACTAASPGSVLCGYVSVELLRASGKCGDIEALARRFVSARPSSPAGYSWLSIGLVGRGAPVEAVEAALEQQLQRATPGTTSYYRARTEGLADARAAYGDFPGALDLLDERDRGDAKLIELSARVWTLRRRLDVLREMGRVEEARTVVRSFLRRSDAYAAHLEGEMEDVHGQAVLLGVEPLSTLIEVAASAPPAQRWLAIYVWDNPPLAFAREAVARMPSAEELQPVHADLLARNDVVTLSGVGVTLARGGRADLAIPWLREGLKPCMYTSLAFSRRHAELELGKALEAQGDKAGAREQYTSILRYWGDAKPRSVTADEAHSRLAALGR
jgi:eukaryotic-like serine/threonine-protein kinase